MCVRITPSNYQEELMSKKQALSLLTFSALVLSPNLAFAEDESDFSYSANVGFVSEYSFRGIAQSDEDPAIQGGFDVEHTSGLYAGYYSANVDVPLPKDFTVSAHIGYQDIDDEAAFGVPDYMDWSVGLGYNLKGFDLSLSYVDTDLSKSECSDGCDSRVIFGISRSF